MLIWQDEKVMQQGSCPQGLLLLDNKQHLFCATVVYDMQARGQRVTATATLVDCLLQAMYVRVKAISIQKHRVLRPQQHCFKARIASVSIRQSSDR